MPVIGLLLLTISVATAAGQAKPATQPADRLAWWRAARFGMFVHWGPVSLKGTEIGWSRGGERRGYGQAGTEVPVEVYDNLKSLKECVQTLVRCAGADGNLLLNVGPMPTGKIETRQAERLREIGAWLAKNGEAIYDTRGGPLKPGLWGVCTHRGNRVYLHILDWSPGEIRIPDLGVAVTGGRLLGGKNVSLSRRDGSYVLIIPKEDRQDIDTIVVLELAGPADSIRPITWPSNSLTSGRPAKASNVFQNQTEYGPDKAVDDDPRTRWATDSGTHEAWLKIDLDKETTFDAVSISEEIQYGQRVEAFEVQCKVGDQWRTCLKGTKVGPDFQAQFTPVSARHVRLSITAAREGPTIKEFRLWKLK